MTIEEPPPVWFDEEVRVLSVSGEESGTGVVRGVVRPWRDRPWAFAVEVDGAADLVGVTGDRLIPTGWFRDADGKRLTAEEHERATAGGARPGDRLRRRHVTLRAHVVASSADEAAVRGRDLVAVLGLDADAADEPVEYWKDPVTWVVVTKVRWPEGVGDDAEVAVAHLAATTGLEWVALGGEGASADAVWNPGDVVGPIPHVTWMALDGVA